MPCLQAIEGEETGNPLTCYIINLLKVLGDKSTGVPYSYISSYCGIERNEAVDQLALSHCADVNSLVNFYIQQLIQIKWDMPVHSRVTYLFGNQH